MTDEKYILRPHRDAKGPGERPMPESEAPWICDNSSILKYAAIAMNNEMFVIVETF